MRTKWRNYLISFQSSFNRDNQKRSGWCLWVDNLLRKRTKPRFCTILGSKESRWSIVIARKQCETRNSLDISDMLHRIVHLQEEILSVGCSRILHICYPLRLERTQSIERIHLGVGVTTKADGPSCYCHLVTIFAIPAIISQTFPAFKRSIFLLVVLVLSACIPIMDITHWC